MGVVSYKQTQSQRQQFITNMNLTGWSDSSFFQGNKWEKYKYICVHKKRTWLLLLLLLLCMCVFSRNARDLCTENWNFFDTTLIIFIFISKQFRCFVLTFTCMHRHWKMELVVIVIVFIFVYNNIEGQFTTICRHVMYGMWVSSQNINSSEKKRIHVW